MKTFELFSIFFIGLVLVLYGLFLLWEIKKHKIKIDTLDSIIKILEADEE